MTTVKDAMGGTSGPGLSGRVLWTHLTPRFLVFVRLGCECESFYLFMRKLFIGFRRRPQHGREDAIPCQNAKNSRNLESVLEGMRGVADLWTCKETAQIFAVDLFSGRAWYVHNFFESLD